MPFPGVFPGGTSYAAKGDLVRCLTLDQLRHHVRQSLTIWREQSAFDCLVCGKNFVEGGRQRIVLHMQRHLHDDFRRFMIYQCLADGCEYTGACSSRAKAHYREIHDEDITGLTAEMFMHPDRGWSFYWEDVPYVMPEPRADVPTREDVLRLLEAAIALGDKKSTRYTFNGVLLLWEFTDDQRVLLTKLHELIINADVTSLQDLYYSIRPQLKAGAKSDDVGVALKVVCEKLGIMRHFFCVNARPDGYAFGSLLMRQGSGHPIVFNQFPVPISEKFTLGLDVVFEPISADGGPTKLEYILFVEDHGTLFKLHSTFINDFPGGLLVAGCGYGSYASRRFCRILAQRFDIPVYVIVDNDPAGLLQALTVKYGSSLKRSVAASGDISVPSAEWVGVRSSDVPLTATSIRWADVSKKELDAVLSRATEVGDHEILAEAELMRQTKRAHHIQCLTTPQLIQFIRDRCPRVRAALAATVPKVSVDGLLATSVPSSTGMADAVLQSDETAAVLKPIGTNARVGRWVAGQAEKGPRPIPGATVIDATTGCLSVPPGSSFTDAVQALKPSDIAAPVVSSMASEQDEDVNKQLTLEHWRVKARERYHLLTSDERRQLNKKTNDRKRIRKKEKRDARNAGGRGSLDSVASSDGSSSSKLLPDATVPKELIGNLPGSLFTDAVQALKPSDVAAPVASSMASEQDEDVNDQHIREVQAEKARTRCHLLTSDDEELIRMLQAQKSRERYHLMTSDERRQLNKKKNERKRIRKIEKRDVRYAGNRVNADVKVVVAPTQGTSTDGKVEIETALTSDDNFNFALGAFLSSHGKTWEDLRCMLSSDSSSSFRSDGEPARKLLPDALVPNVSIGEDAGTSGLSYVQTVTNASVGPQKRKPTSSTSSTVTSTSSNSVTVPTVADVDADDDGDAAVSRQKAPTRQKRKTAVAAAAWLADHAKKARGASDSDADSTSSADSRDNKPWFLSDHESDLGY